MAFFYDKDDNFILAVPQNLEKDAEEILKEIIDPLREDT
jgi:hypothetical protein